MKYLNKNNIIIIVVLLPFTFIFADTDGDLSVEGTGSLPFCASWTSSGGSAPDWSSIDIDDYDADYKEFSAMIVVTDFDANYAFNISASKGNWTLPSAYDETNGAKKSNGADSDFLIKVSGIGVGTTPESSGGLAVANSHDSYQAVTKSGTVILNGGSTTSGSAHGVETASFTLDGKILLDWGTDIPGAYALTITLTIASQ